MLPQQRDAFGPHPLGEANSTSLSGQDDTIPIETPGGIFHVRIDPDAEVSQFGGLIPFIQFLKASGLLSSWEADCPLYRSSPNAASTRALLGTWIAAVASGQSRYAHVTAIRGDSVIPEILGCKRLVSEDTIRRGISTLVGDPLRRDPEACEAQQSLSTSWARRHLLQSVSPLLVDDWILDIDVTVKPLYGFQEGSVVGHNPHKPGRPSHAIHAFIIGKLRLIIDATVHPGDAHSSATTIPDLMTVLEDLPANQQPSLIRGDCGFGNENMMNLCEGRGLDYLFKQRQTVRTQAMVDMVDRGDDWVDTGQGWQATESILELSTWSRPRRAVILRRPKQKRYPRRADLESQKEAKQECIDLCQPLIDDQVYEYQVLVTSLDTDLTMIAQCYRDRADCENNFDELKNHWGWGGFTSKSLPATQLALRMVAQVYNWWSIFVRILSPEHHREAITSRPVLLHNIARKTQSGGQRFLYITSTHRWKNRIAGALAAISSYFEKFGLNAEQLPWKKRWETLLHDNFRRARAPAPA